VVCSARWWRRCGTGAPPDLAAPRAPGQRRVRTITGRNPTRNVCGPGRRVAARPA
jgi:hypothetical protein